MVRTESAGCRTKRYRGRSGLAIAPWKLGSLLVGLARVLEELQPDARLRRVRQLQVLPKHVLAIELLGARFALVQLVVDLDVHGQGPRRVYAALVLFTTEAAHVVSFDGARFVRIRDALVRRLVRCQPAARPRERPQMDGRDVTLSFVHAAEPTLAKGADVRLLRLVQLEFV